MHDFFDIVGLPRSAPPVEVRRVCARLTRRAHPDFRHPGFDAAVTHRGPAAALPIRRDVAVDFADMSVLLDRIQASFFQSGPRAAL